MLLKGDPAVEGSDYINASFIDVSTATTLSIIVVAIQIITGIPQQKRSIHSLARSESIIMVPCRTIQSQ